MKELSIADLIALSRHCTNMLNSKHIKDSDAISYLYDIWNACDKELNKRMASIYTSINNVSTT